MSYVKKDWQDKPSTVSSMSAANLGHLETQYDEAINEVAAQLVVPSSAIGSQLAVGVAGGSDVRMTATDNDPASAFRVQQDARLSTTFVPALVFKGTPDAVIAKDVATIGGSAIIDAASGPFLPSHVGKTITVGMAGASGADLSTTVLSYQNATRVTLATAATVRVTSAGVLVGTDNGPALQTALNKLDTAHGGTLYIPAGKYALWTPITKNFQASFAPSIAIRGDGTTSEIFIATGNATNAITLQNLSRLAVENLVLTGNPTAQNDASSTVRLEYVEQATFRDVGFFGLANGATAGDTGSRGVIETDRSDLRFERCYFGGTTSSQGINNSVVRLTNCRGFSADNTIWLDWANHNGIVFNKTVNSSALAWVDVISYETQVDAHEQSVVRLTDCRMDEGALYGFHHHPFPGRAGHIIIDGLQQNVSLLGPGVGVRIMTANNVTIKDSWLGYVISGAHDGVWLDDITGSATLTRVTTAGTARTIRASASVAVLDIEECDVGAVVSAAAITNVRKGGKGGSPIFSKAGVPSDADFLSAPPIGTMALDSTALKLYVRTGAATWKATAALV